MGWKFFDYRCPKCGNEFESMEKDANDLVFCQKIVRGDLHGVPAETCGELALWIPSANLGWTNNKETQMEMLKKRSAEHTAKEQKSGNMLSPKDIKF